MKPTQIPTLFHMHTLLSLPSSSLRDLRLSEAPTACLIATHFFLPFISHLCHNLRCRSLAFPVEGSPPAARWEEAAGTPKSSLQRESLWATAKGTKGPTILRLRVCPAPGPAWPAAGHLRQLSSQGSRMLLSSGPGSRFSGQALPRRSRGPSPFGVWGTFPFLSLSLAPNHRGKKKKSGPIYKRSQ